MLDTIVWLVILPVKVDGSIIADSSGSAGEVNVVEELGMPGAGIIGVWVRTWSNGQERQYKQSGDSKTAKGPVPSRRHLASSLHIVG